MSEINSTSEPQTSSGAYLIINSQIFLLSKDTVTLGRKLENDLVVQEPLVSRFHAEVRLEGGRYSIHDMGSTSGTFINNKRIESANLYSGDIILLANVPIMFVDQSEALSAQSKVKTGQLPEDT